MSIIALKLDAEDNVIGYAIVPDLDTLALQPWPLDRYRIVPDDHEITVEVMRDAVGFPQRRVYHVRPKVVR